MKQKQAITRVTAGRYRAAGKKEKRQLLDEFCRTTGYNRCYARWVLRRQGQRVELSPSLVLEADGRPRPRRAKPKIYDDTIAQVLVQLWEMLDYLCGKRLVAILPEMVAKLEQFDELHLEPETRRKLLQMSHGRSHTATAAKKTFVTWSRADHAGEFAEAPDSDPDFCGLE